MKYLLLAAFSFCFAFANAQVEVDDEDEPVLEKFRMVSINMTPLITQLIPFNRTNPMLSGPYNVEFHRYRGDRAFHSSLGVFFVSDIFGNSLDNAHFNLRMGSEKRRKLNEKWTLYKGWDGYISIGSLNLLSSPQAPQTELVGLGPRWGLGYTINEPVSISIETALLVGYDFDSESINFQFIPPVSVNLNFVFPKRG